MAKKRSATPEKKPETPPVAKGLPRGRPPGEAFAGTVLSVKLPARLHERLKTAVEVSGFRTAEILRQGLDKRLGELENRENKSEESDCKSV